MDLGLGEGRCKNVTYKHISNFSFLGMLIITLEEKMLILGDDC